jgi:hypothetical protein
LASLSPIIDSGGVERALQVREQLARFHMYVCAWARPEVVDKLDTRGLSRFLQLTHRGAQVLVILAHQPASARSPVEPSATCCSFTVS